MIMPITIRAIKKSEPGRMKAALIRIGAMILALVASSLFIFLLNLNPVDVYIKMVQGHSVRPIE